MDDINKRNTVFMIDITCFQYCLFEIHYIEVMANNSKITFVPTMKIENLVRTAAIKAEEGHVIHFAPAVRKHNSGTQSGSKNIFLAGCFWVNIDSPKKGLNFEQRQNEADTLLAGFRQRLQEYNMSPSYIVSTGYGYTLLSHRENLSMDGKKALRTLLKANKRLQTAYLLKESFGQLWEYRSEAWARKFFDNWCASLKGQKLEPFEKFAKMIDRHWEGIAAYCLPENKVSLGFVEGLNNKIRVIQRRSYGLRDEEYLRLKILTSMLPEI